MVAIEARETARGREGIDCRADEIERVLSPRLHRPSDGAT
jgi:hypothetical protein